LNLTTEIGHLQDTIASIDRGPRRFLKDGMRFLELQTILQLRTMQQSFIRLRIRDLKKESLDLVTSSGFFRPMQTASATRSMCRLEEIDQEIAHLEGGVPALPSAVSTSSSSLLGPDTSISRLASRA